MLIIFTPFLLFILPTLTSPLESFLAVNVPAEVSLYFLLLVKLIKVVVPSIFIFSVLVFGESAILIVLASQKTVKLKSNVKFRLKKDGTTPTIEDVEAEFTSEDQIGWAVTVVPSGSSASIRVQGAVNNNINWISRTRFSELT